MRRVRRVFAISFLLLVALPVAAALGAFPGSNPNESVRVNTPNDPRFDQCEPDNENSPPAETCTNVFDEDWQRFGFAPNASQTTATYKNLTAPHTIRQMAQNTLAGRNPAGQVSGVSVDRAWKRSTGRPDVQVAILDTGIRWDRASLRKKVALNADELPEPQTTGGAACGRDDCNEDGAFDVEDYANDPRVEETTGVDDADSVLDPSDLIHDPAFADGSDADDNGFADDIAGWDFFDDDNDPYDASSYSSASNHGSGRAEEAAAQTNDANGGTGLCPRCQVVPMRVWDTFVVDTNNFAQAVGYAADNDVEVVEGAVGGLLNSRFARAAFRKAYESGVFMAIVSSDLNTANHNFPTTYDEAMMVQGTVSDANGLGTDAPGLSDLIAGINTLLGQIPDTNLSIGSTVPITTWFRNSGTTQYGGHAHVAMPGTTGSEATGQASGAAGLLASLFRQTHANGDNGPSSLQPNEIKQLMTMTAEDVVPENTEASGVLGTILPTLPPDPSQPGWDQHFGYGRPDLGLAAEAIAEGEVPPQALITSPDWFAPLRVRGGAQDAVQVAGRLSAPRADGGDFRWKLQWAPGIEPGEGEFEDVDDWHDAGDPVDGVLGTVDLDAVRAALDGRSESCGANTPLTGGPNPATGGSACDPTAPGKGPGDVDPNEPAFTVRVQVEYEKPGSSDTVRGEDRKTLFAYEDDTLHQGWSRRIGTGGEASQRMFDLDGDNLLEVIEATSSGELSVLRHDGTPHPAFNGGQPVQTQTYPNAHPGAPFYDGLEPPREPLRTPAIGDIDGDGEPEIVDTGGEHVYAWEAGGNVVDGFPKRVDPSLSEPADRTRQNHVKRGFFASPTLGDLDDDGDLEIVAPALDQHVYAFDGSGDALPGFPAKLDVPSENLDGAEIINTAAVGDIAGDDKPEIVVATNELGAASTPAPPNGLGDVAGAFSQLVTNLAANALGGSGRVYAIDGEGQILPGWPIKPDAILPDVLPLAGPGQDQVLGNMDDDPKLETVGAVTTGEVTATNGDGSSAGAYPSTPSTGEAPTGVKVLNLFENPILADVDSTLPGAEVFKVGVTLPAAINLGVLTGQNLPYHHVLQGWGRDPSGGQKVSLPAFPQAVEDYQLLSSPAAADVSDAPGNEVLSGSGMYLLRNINSLGQEGTGWPKFTGGWLYAVPSVGDVDGDGKLEVAAVTREGNSFLWDTDSPACGTNDEWWTSRHDEWSTGARDTDSRPPGTPGNLRVSGSTLSFIAPGDDWFCGTADRYRVITSDAPIGGPEDGSVVGEFDAGQSAGQTVTRPLPEGSRRAHLRRFVGVAFQDEQGNWGHVATAAVSRGGSGSPGGNVVVPPVRTRKPASKGCLNNRGGARGRRLGPARLGLKKASQRRALKGRRLRSRAGLDRYCAAGGGSFRVGYPTARLNRGIGRALRRRVRDRVVLVLTSSKRFSVAGTRPGASTRTLRRRLRGERRIKVGGNTWYLARGRSVRLLFQTRGGRVRAVGIGQPRLTAGRRAARRYLRAWQLGG